ncbi:TetR family transcriptional regulator [Streptomyces triticagri]|uniref:TetR family transcriptional regulator n=1 Tax=Streptomyces triticagri TaxID=2293568 RepID=A0A372MCJ9_9ACTN|nr:TetR/AcrR family transcriptional regulator C-terminal domain-containing protein [Streptomyces triticagri]RFU88559.1 TetR family transcriptional regulator [Streptomyces triticagri]RFU88631.1 TetR family transcriptional regulator [Streptomyces triticagri]
MAARRARGHSAGLTRQVVLEAALGLSDRDGLKALSMRRLGEELGVEAMALYHHVPNKDALLDGMVEQVVAEAVPEEFGPANWQEGLRTYAAALDAALAAHPQVVPLLMSRPAVTPRNLQLMETVVGALHGAGFPLRRALDVVYAVTSFVIGHAAAQGGAVGEADGESADLAAMDPEAYPLLVRAAEESGAAPAAERFDFALGALLSGFEAEAGRPERAAAEG